MECQMIGSGETSLAVATLERFGACVFPVMPRKFVASGESPLAALPGAFVRLLTWNHINKYGRWNVCLLFEIGKINWKCVCANTRRISITNVNWMSLQSNLWNINYSLYFERCEFIWWINRNYIYFITYCPHQRHSKEADTFDVNLIIFNKCIV